MTQAGAAPLLILTQGHAGDRLGARLAPALRESLPEHPLLGVGGEKMAAAGVHLLARADRVSAMGWTGVLPAVPAVLNVVRAASAATRKRPPACVIAVDVWQPLQALHRWAPHLAEAPHVCYLPPGPNFIGPSRLHAAAAAKFQAILTPFEHQARLFEAAGARVRRAAHAGLQACLEEAVPLPAAAREERLALLPGSRALEVRYSLPVQLAAAERIAAKRPGLAPVVCCVDARVEMAAQRESPGVQTSASARAEMARARFALICSGTASLEAAVLGCPGVVTYHGSRLQAWEWNRFHVPRLARLRAEGIASPWISLPNIILGEEIYPELIASPAEAIAAAAERQLERPAEEVRAALDRVRDALHWEDAGEALAEEVRRVVR